MPKLSIQDRPIKRIDLPSSTPEDPAWVDVYETVITKDMISLQDVGENKSLATLQAITNIIKDWNFTDGDNKAPIDIDHVNLLTFDDFMAIMESIKAFRELVDLSPEIKKNVSSISQQSENETRPKTPAA